jgi:signal transduction histidine kinase
MIAKPNYFPIFFIFISLLWQSCNTISDSSATTEYDNYIKKAAYYEGKTKLDSAFYYYTRASNTTEVLSANQKAYVKLQLARIQQAQADFYGAETTLTEGLAEYKDSLYLPYFYNLLGVVFTEQKNYEDGELYYNKTKTVTKDQNIKWVIDNNIGVISLYKKNYNIAVQQFNSLVRNAELKKSPLEYARVLDNYGFARFKLGRTDGFLYLKQSYTMRDSLEDYQGKIASTIHLAEYFKDKDPGIAERYAEEALKNATIIESPNDRLEALQWLTMITDGATNRNYLAQYHHLNDSLSTARQTARNTFAKIKYDVNKAQQDSLKQQEQKERVMLVTACLLLLGGFAFGFYAVNSKRKLEKATYSTETRISKRIHDELANDVFNTMAFAQTQDLEMTTNKEKLIEFLSGIYSRTRNISKENSTIRTDKNFMLDLEEMMQSFSDAHCNVIKNEATDILWNNIASQKKIAIYRVLQELLVNTRKHSAASLVVIGLKQVSNKIHINYTDNGKGFVLSEKSTSGLYNAENRIKAIKGTLIFETKENRGCNAQIIIPK